MVDTRAYNTKGGGWRASALQRQTITLRGNFAHNVFLLWGSLRFLGSCLSLTQLIARIDLGVVPGGFAE